MRAARDSQSRKVLQVDVVHVVLHGHEQVDRLSVNLHVLVVDVRPGGLVDGGRPAGHPVPLRVLRAHPRAPARHQLQELLSDVRVEPPVDDRVRDRGRHGDHVDDREADVDLLRRALEHVRRRLQVSDQGEAAEGQPTHDEDDRDHCNQKKTIPGITNGSFAYPLVPTPTV